MRQTPVNDYLEEISTELPEELYGNLSDAVYETVCDFNEEVAQLKVENAKLRELCADLYAEMITYSSAPHYNASVWTQKLRELGVKVD